MSRRSRKEEKKSEIREVLSIEGSVSLRGVLMSTLGATNVRVLDHTTCHGFGQNPSSSSSTCV